MTSLQPALQLQSEETITGYVSRYAALFDTTPRDFCSDLGMRWQYLCSGHEDQLRQLAWLTDQPFEVLLARRTVKLEANRYSVGRAVAGGDIFRRTVVRLCPQCIAEQLLANRPEVIVQKLDWSMLCLHSCPIHHCAIITLPSAGHSHVSYDFVGQILENKEAVLAASQDSCDVERTSFEDYTRMRIWHGAQNDWLQRVDLSDLCGASFSLGASLAGLRSREFGRVSEEARRRLIERGFKHLKAGENEYLSALRMRYGKGVGRPLPHSDFGAHFGWLRRNADRLEVGAVVQAAREYILSTYPAPPGKALLGARPERKQLLTMEDARRRTGLGVVFLKKLIGHVEGQTETEALKRTDVHIDELVKAERCWAKLAPLGEAAKRLHIRTSQVRHLQDLGVLRLIKITSTQRYTLQEQIDGLLEAVEALPVCVSCRGALTLREFCRCKGVPLARVIQMWCSGALVDGIARSEGAGLHALKITSEVEMDRPVASLASDLAVPEAARYLMINTPAVRALRDAGYLDEIERHNPDTKYLKRFITRDSMERFERTYVTLGQLADARGKAARHLARELDRNCVEPMPDLGKGVRIYLRNTVI